MRPMTILALLALAGACSPEGADTAADPGERETMTRPSDDPKAPDAPTSFLRAPGPRHHHDEVNIACLLAAFPIDRLIESGRDVDGDVISSPVHLAILEQVRAQAARGHDLGPAKPVDLFLWAAGPPRKSHLTRLGGVPHREKGKAWPKDADGRPMTFAAQFCFADSLDILERQPPGEILLVFFAKQWPWPLQGEPVMHHLEWSERELEEPMTAADLPATGFVLPELHGVRHRTSQYPEAFFGDGGDVFEKLGHAFGRHHAITQGTMIGPETWFIQNEPQRGSEVLIAALSSFQLTRDWPLVNRSELEPLPELMFYDVGCYYFLLDRRGRVRMAFDCY